VVEYLRLIDVDCLVPAYLSSWYTIIVIDLKRRLTEGLVGGQLQSEPSDYFLSRLRTIDG
jgi:hypothetical protein